MESDEESPLVPSSPVHERRLKRLKKSIKVSQHSSPTLSTRRKPSTPMSPPLNYHSDYTYDQDFEDSEAGSQPGSDRFPDDGGLRNSRPQDSQRNEEEYISSAKIIPDVDSVSQQQFVGNGVPQCVETRIEEDISVVVSRKDERPSEKKIGFFAGISSEKKQKNKKRIEDNGEKRKTSSSLNNRSADKERREHLQQLRAESQRLLRETRDVAFKHIPLVEKPISSLLEKIRLRKQQVSIKSFNSKDNDCNDGFSREVMMDSDNERAPIDERLNMVENFEGEESIAFNDYDKDGLGLDKLQTGGSTDAADCTNLEVISSHVICEKALDKKSVQEVRTPVDDTQELVCDSQMNDAKDELSNDYSSQEEAFEPSVLAMNLRLDSAPPDDVLSNEEDNDKENAIPRLQGSAGLSLSPGGDPVKAFVDEEAEEEDDSDNDLNLQENEEDEENDDAEELMDMIATTYEERPIETEMRNQLHQQWLEQQDAAGTDKLLQKLKYGSNLRYTSLDKEEEDEDEGEDHDDIVNDAEQDLAPSNVARMNLKRVKQMLPQVFTDKDDPYISDDEETASQLAKECLLQKTQEQATFLSPAVDENSREVFGLIKKLNTIEDVKKKTKPASFVDVPLIGQQRIMSSKSSFLHRGSNHSLPSQKNGSSKVRSFIFGRDESNSRTPISSSRESSDTIHSKSQQTKSYSAKYVSITQNTGSKSAMFSTSSKTSTSPYEILRRPSQREAHSVHNNLVHQSESVFAAFKLTQKTIKSEGKM